MIDLIKSVLWANMLDYPGHVSTSLFFDGCNMDCEFCQNKLLAKEKTIDFDTEILPKLLERKEMVEYVVLSGGECTIAKECQRVIDVLHRNGFKIGLHTNGYYPEFLEKNISKISYIGMDIKNSFENYDDISGVEIDVEKIKKSIDIIINNLKDYEFRTTVYPKYIDTEDCEQIAKYLGEKNAKIYVLQQYKMVNGVNVIPFSKEKLENIRDLCNKYVKTNLRGIKD